MKRYLSLCLAALLVLALLPTMALATTTTEVDSDDELVKAIQNAKKDATIVLTANIDVDVTGVAKNSGKFIVPSGVTGVTIDGGEHTITVKGNAEASLFLVSEKGSSATIKDLTIIGSEGIKHGMQAYDGATLDVENVKVHDCKGYALVVNGSTVTVNGLTTSGNDWGGINVDLGDGVTNPATLTIEEATIAEGNSVKVEHTYSDNVKVTATIKGGSFHSVVNAKGQSDKTTLTVSGGTFTTPPTEYVSDSSMTECTVNGTTYVNTGEYFANNMKLEKGCTITVWKGDLKLPDLPAGATVTNKGDGKVTVGSTSVGQNDSYPPQPTEPTEPTKPIAGVVIGGGNQQEDEDEPEQSPSNTLRYAVICRTLNVRSGPGTEYSKLGTLSRGTLLDGELLSNGWVKFSYNGQTAYVSGMYVQSVENGQLSVQCGTLNVRSGAGTSYSKIGALYRGTYVKPLETQGNWYKIGYDGGYGWICADYVG